MCATKDCNVFSCEKRHPRQCIYQRDFGRCKFTTSCKYDHRKPRDILENSNKIIDIQKKLDNFVDLGKHVERKMETFDNTVDNTKKTAIENNARSENLENLINKMETRLNKLESGEINKKITDLENIIKNQQKKIEELEVKSKALEAFYNEKVFKCTQCEFTSVSEKGLKSHVVRKHKTEKKKKEETLQYPRNCDLCEKEIKNKNEMKTHMRTHSYKNVSYKCNKCEFLGYSEIDVSVHSGKAHGDCFECGLCEHISPDLETLELHLFTCEIYQCNNCETIFKNLGDLKSHLVKEHESSSTHIKQSRENEDEYDNKRYTYKELFPEKGMEVGAKK